MQAHPAGAGLPELPLCFTKSRMLIPCHAAVLRLEQRGIFDACVNDVGIRERRLNVPHALEFPWALRAVVELMRAGVANVQEVLADRLPRGATVVRSLHHLTEPAARLRGVDPIGIDGRSLDMIDLPPREVWPTDLPILPVAVGGKHERSLLRADEYSNTAHRN